MSERERGQEGSAGPGAGPVPRAAIVLFSGIAIVLGLLALYSLWTFWPEGVQDEEAARRPQSVTWFSWHFSLDREFLFFLTVALAGALGGLIHTIRSFTWYAGNRTLVWSWIPYNMLLPVVGALAGTVFYLVLRAGLFSPSTSVEQASPFGFAAVSILAGLFSPQAFEKLKLIAADIFAEPPSGEDHTPARPGDRS
jgi:hypothetical protein